MPSIVLSGTVLKAVSGCAEKSPCRNEAGNSSCATISYPFFPGMVIDRPRVFVRDQAGQFEQRAVGTITDSAVFENYEQINVAETNEGNAPTAAYIMASVRLRSWNTTSDIHYKVEFPYKAFPRKVKVISPKGDVPPRASGTVNLFPEGPFNGLPDGSNISDAQIWATVDGRHWNMWPLNADLGGLRGELKVFPKGDPNPADKSKWTKFFPYIEVTITTPVPHIRPLTSGCTVDFPEGFDAYEDHSVNLSMNWEWGK